MWINDYFLNGIGNSTSVGYRSMHTLRNLPRHFDPFSPYLQWSEGHVEDDKSILRFFYRNVPDCVRYFLRLIAYRDNLVYALRREYDQTGKTIYPEMHTAYWWWEFQVLPRSLFYVKAY